MVFFTPESELRRNKRPKRDSRQAIPKAVKLRVLARFDGLCGYCGEKPLRLQVDHMTPVAMGGTNDESNLMPACHPCNNYKMSWPVYLFRQELEKNVERARKYSLNFRLAERFGLVRTTGGAIVFHFEKVQT
jgi:5-methylcytosine-specific restriction endonuclease McrA